ncbi:hypothetical protein TRVL_07378 [Trypanosoma vivax]|nr:hypothetical protein TRVL_07378 [Trypanosoma vivax]
MSLVPTRIPQRQASSTAPLSCRVSLLTRRCISAMPNLRASELCTATITAPPTPSASCACAASTTRIKRLITDRGEACSALTTIMAVCVTSLGASTSRTSTPFGL